MGLAHRLAEVRSGFSPAFWIANTFELFERFAFYGSKAVLTVFLANKVGLKEEAGTLAGLFSGVIFFLPIVAGVLVDKYGFKKTLMACFAIFTVGYFLIGLAGLEFGETLMGVVGRKTYIITVLMLTAIGGSLIKPCIVGTVAKTSKPDVKSLGFSIYYTLGNIGGAIGPILALYIREDLGIEYVLIMSSITSFFLFIGTLLFFEGPPVNQDESEQRTFGKVFSDMILVFGNIRFISFLVIFSGFWIMFWQIYYLLPFYSTDVLNYDNFEVLETVDAICIIFLTVPMAALVKKWKPITAMTLGFVFATLSWIIIGAIGTVTATIAGIALFALGESTQAPRFYEYVSTLAPKNQLGTFMGFSFLPVAIGSFAAGPVADWLRTSYLTTNPSLMWYMLAGIGLISTLLMIFYNVFIAPKQSHQPNKS
jgi:POT family proton-dependent oligopeptide transporter